MRLSFISLILMLYSSAILAVPSQDQLKKDLGLENVIIFSHVVAKDTPKGVGAEQLKQLVEKQKKDLSGFPKVQVYPDSVLFDDTKVMQALADNKVQLAAPSISKLLTINPKLKIFDFPFLFKDVNEVLTFYNSARGKLFFPEKDKVEDNTVQYLDEGKKYPVLGLWHGGMKQITSNKEVIVSNDNPLTGFTFRIQSSPVIKLMFDVLGAKSVSEDDFAKVYKKLKNKEIDAQENTWSNILTGKFYEVQQYFLESNHGYLGYLLITNQRFLDERLRDSSGGAKWQGILKEVENGVKQEAIEGNEKAKKGIEKNKKLEIKQLEEHHREKWCERIYESQYSEWKKLVDEVGKEIVREAIKGKADQCPYSFLKALIERSK